MRDLLPHMGFLRQYNKAPIYVTTPGQPTPSPAAQPCTLTPPRLPYHMARAATWLHQRSAPSLLDRFDASSLRARDAAHLAGSAHRESNTPARSATPS
jgi:hypothetical protein